MESSAQVGGSSQNQKVIIEPVKFHLEGKKPLLWVPATKDHWAHALTGSYHLSSQACSTQGL